MQEAETRVARQRCGDPEMEKGAMWRLKTQRPRDIQRGGDPEKC